MGTIEGHTSLVTLAQAERELRDTHRAVKDENDRHETEAALRESAVREATRRRDLVLAGVPLDVVKIAEEVLDVFNPQKATYGEGRGAVLAAITDLAEGPKELLTRYYGTKDYAQWRGQRSDGTYGSGPSHGHMVFHIGLATPYRDSRWKTEDQAAPVELTDEQRGAAIAYLHALLR